jgi:hypothetical protein
MNGGEENMKKLKELLLVCLLITPLVATSCGGNNGGGGTGGGSGGLTLPPVGQREIVDLIVADRDWDGVMDASASEERVLIYLDVLNNTAGNLQDPSAILDFTGSDIDGPRHVFLSDDDAFVSEDDEAEVHIFRDYQTLSNGNAPDVTLGAVATISAPDMVRSYNDILIVADSGDDTIKLWDNESALAADTLPTTELDTATSLIDDAQGFWYADDTLWVANSGGDSTGVTDEECVVRFDGLAAIAAGGVAVAPDGVLNQDDSFLDFGYPCKRVYVDPISNVLYVMTNDSDDTDDNGLFVFADADAVDDGDLPIAVIGATGAILQNPMNARRFNDRIYVAQVNQDDEDDCTNFPGVHAWDLNATNGAILSGQRPSVALGGLNGIIGSQTIETINDWFFVQSVLNCEDEGLGDVFVFWGGNGGPESGDSPVIVLPALKDFASPVALHAKLRVF